MVFFWYLIDCNNFMAGGFRLTRLPSVMRMYWHRTVFDTKIRPILWKKMHHLHPYDSRYYHCSNHHLTYRTNVPLLTYNSVNHNTIATNSLRFPKGLVSCLHLMSNRHSNVDRTKRLILIKDNSSIYHFEHLYYRWVKTLIDENTCTNTHSFIYADRHIWVGK